MSRKLYNEHVTYEIAENSFYSGYYSTDYFLVIKLPNLERLLAVRQALLFHPFYFSLITYQNFKNFRFPKFVNFIPRLARFLFPKMRMLCDRLSALTAGAMVGVWYAQNFPCENPTDGGDKDKAKDKAKSTDKGKEKEKDKGKGKDGGQDKGKEKGKE